MTFNVVSYIIGAVHGGGGGGEVTVEPKTLTANGDYSAPDGTAWSPVHVRVPEAEVATPTINVSESGLITASTSQEAGVVEAGEKTAEEQLPVQAGKTVTPGVSDQEAVGAGKYTTGAVIVAGDQNLLPENIRNGVTIFGVTGTYASDATATSANILEGKTAYVSTGKVTGVAKAAFDGESLIIPEGLVNMNG